MDEVDQHFSRLSKLSEIWMAWDYFWLSTNLETECNVASNLYNPNADLVDNNGYIQLWTDLIWRPRRFEEICNNLNNVI